MIDCSDEFLKYIKRKEYFKIKNRFSLLNESNNDKFIINIYYLEENLCKVIVRRTDVNSGWEQDLKIKIKIECIGEGDEGDLYEILSIGSSYHNNKIIDFYTIVKLEKLIVEKKTSIFPGKIVFLVENKKFSNFKQYLNILELYDNNCNYEFIFFDELDQRKIIKNHCFKYLEIFDMANSKELKNMIFICNYLYLNGGMYISEEILLKDRICEIMHDKNLLYWYEENIIKFLLVPKNEVLILNYINDLLNNNNYDICLNFSGKFKMIDESYYEKNIEGSLIVDKKNNISSLFFNLNNYKFWIYLDNESILSEAKFNIEYLNLNYYLLKVWFDENNNSNENKNSENNNIKIKYLNENNDEINVVNINYNKLNKGNYIFKV